MQDKGTVMVEEFLYPQSGALTHASWAHIPRVDRGSGSIENTISSGLQDLPDEPPGTLRDQLASQVAEEAQRSFAAGRTQGIEEGRQLEREEQSSRIREIEKKKIQEVAQLADQLSDERRTFLRTLESEVVKLSLSIASRILRREAQMDPLFLLGAVRVALGQLAETATARLRVPAADADLWSDTIAHLPNLKVRPAVTADEAMSLGDCLLESDMGIADLGVGSQLTQIARGILGDTSALAASDASQIGWKDPVQQ